MESCDWGKGEKMFSFSEPGITESDSSTCDKNDINDIANGVNSYCKSAIRIYYKLLQLKKLF